MSQTRIRQRSTIVEECHYTSYVTQTTWAFQTHVVIIIKIIIIIITIVIISTQISKFRTGSKLKNVDRYNCVNDDVSVPDAYLYQFITQAYVRLRKNVASCWETFFLSLLCLEFVMKLIKDVLHNEVLSQPLRGYLLVREEKATWSLSEEIEEK